MFTKSFKKSLKKCSQVTLAKIDLSLVGTNNPLGINMYNESRFQNRLSKILLSFGKMLNVA
jgi:hypothetical protein